MKRSVIATLIIACMAIPALGASAKGSKIGYVDLQRALKEVEEAKDAYAVLKADFDKKQQELDQKTEAIKKLKDELENQSLVVKGPPKLEQQQMFQQKLMELQSLYVKLQQDLNARENEYKDKILGKMFTIIEKIAKDEGFEYVVDKRSILYGPNSNDVTNEVIRLYNKKHPSKGGKKK